MFHHDQQRTGYVPEEGPQTNAILWIAETAEWADGSPAVYNGKVFVPTWPDMNFGEASPMGLVCYDAVTGAEAWTNELGGASVGSVSGVAVADGCVYLGGTDGRLYCIDEETGETLWVSDRIDTTGYFGLSSSPLVYEGKIYALSASDGVLHAFNAGGTEAWRFETGNGVMYFTSPAGYDGKIYCAGNRSQIFCIDPAAQTAIWTFNQGGSVKSSPVIGADGTVYFTTSSRCYALDGSTGKERWNSSVTGTMSTPVIADGYIYAGAYDGLHCLDASTGEEEWHFQAKEVNVAPVVAGNLVYAATNEETGTLYAVDAETGEPVWSYSLEAPGDGTFSAFYTSSPAVSGGVLYIGAENNRFYAFGEGEVPEPAFTGWSGTVSLADGQTFEVTPFNNESAVYSINRTSAFGALDAAAMKGGFNYTIQETAWGLFLYSIGGIAYNETTWDSWLYSVNGVPAEVGAADYSLREGDIVTYWYGPWGSSPETARAAVNITVSIQASGGGGGDGGGGGGDSSPSWVSVTLAAGTFNITATNSGKTYTVDRQTALGALDATGIAYTINDAYYQEYGSLFIDSIRGRANEGTAGWMYQVNAESPGVGANAYAVQNGDEVVFFWSEGMSSTPATSRDTIFIRVVTPGSSSGGSGSGSSGSSSGGSGSTSTTATTGTGEPGEVLSFPLGLPAGATVKLGEWGQSFSIDLTAGDRSTEQVNVSGNTVTINREGVRLVITARNIDKKGGLAAGLVERVTASVGPVRANFSATGVIAASVNLNLTGIPGDGQIRISLNETPDAETAREFHLASAENGKDVTAVAYSMTVTRINLENGRDVAGAVITMAINPAWVDEHGGPDAIRIARSAEDGTCTILDTRPAGSDADGNLIFEAVSPNGLSTFGLLAVGVVPAAGAGGEEETGVIAPTTAPGSLATTPEMHNTAANLPLSSPLLIIGVCTILLVGAAYLIIKGRRT
jgi:outer membrane protein assembly factor BamB